MRLVRSVEVCVSTRDLDPVAEPSRSVSELDDVSAVVLALSLIYGGCGLSLSLFPFRYAERENLLGWHCVTIQ